MAFLIGGPVTALPAIGVFLSLFKPLVFWLFAAPGRFLRKVFAADPLLCPDCNGPMRIVAFIEAPVVRAIL